MSLGIGTLATNVSGIVAGGPDCLASTNIALSALSGTGGQLVFPAGAYTFSAGITDPGNVTVRCLRGASFVGPGAASINAIAIYDVSTGPGTSGQFAKSQGPGLPPIWDVVISAANGYSAGSTPPVLASAASYTVAGSMGLNDISNGQMKGIHAGMFTDAAAAGACALIASAGLGAGAVWAVDLLGRLTPSFNRNYPQLGVCVATGITAGDTAYGMCVFSANGTTSFHQLVMHPGAGRVSVGNEQSGIGTIGGGGGGFGGAYLRVCNDGTILHYQTSYDGVLWVDWFSAASPVGLGYYGFLQGNDFSSANGYSQATIYQNSLSTPANGAVVSASNTSPIVVGLGPDIGLQDGDMVAIHGVTGNTAANTGGGGSVYNSAAAFIHRLTPTTFQLVGINGNGAYAGGGTVTLISR